MRRTVVTVVLVGVVLVAVVSGTSSPNAATGTSLMQLPGRLGCFTPRGGEGCTAGQGLLDLRSVAISGDGRSVYVVGMRSLVVFSRAASGALHEIECFGDAEPGEVPLVAGCVAMPHLWPQTVVVSRDGRNVYVASAMDDRRHGDYYFSGVLALRRDASSGRLTLLPGLAGCVVGAEAARYRKINSAGTCTVARGLSYTTSIAVAPDGRYVYAAGTGGISVFSRRADGALVQLPGRDGCLLARRHTTCAAGSRHEADVGPIAVSANGRSLYAIEVLDDQRRENPASALLTFARNSRDGTLRQLTGPAGCIVAPGYPLPGCRWASGLRGRSWEFSLLASTDDRNVYVGVAETVATFGAAHGGGLARLAPRKSCLGLGTSSTCGHGNVGNPFTGLALSNDGRTLLFASETDIGRVALLRRDISSGALRRLGCVAAAARHGCVRVRALHCPAGIAISPDGANAYAVGTTVDGDNGEIAAFAMTG